MNVLVLEDDQLVARSLLRCLEQLGHQGAHASNLAEARKLWGERAQWQVVILDVDLGADESGLQFLDWLRGQPTASRRIVMSGARQGATELLPALECFVRKPVSISELRALLG